MRVSVIIIPITTGSNPRNTMSEETNIEKNAALADSLRREAARAELLAGITAKVNKGVTLTEVLDHIYDSFHEAIPYDRIGFSLLEDGGKTARAVWIRSEQADKNIDTGYVARIEGSSLAKIIETGRPRVINDLEAYLAEHPDSESTRRIVADGIRSSLTCPLTATDKPVGFIFFSSVAKETYKDEHVDFFMRIADQLAVIVEKGRLYQNLVELNELKNRFLGIAAHDLRSPLAAVKGFLNLFLGGYIGNVPETQLGYLKKIDAAIDRMYSLINDLLDISAIESGKLVLSLEETDPAEYLKSFFDMNGIIAGAKSMKLKLEVEPNLPNVRMDVKRIDQALGNLLTNAIKFSLPGTEITIGARRADGGVMFYVADQGQGIPAEELPKLFSDFSRTTVRPTGGEKSTGLGLAIVKRIAVAHGGTVGVESEPGKGSIFHFNLPVEN